MRARSGCRARTGTGRAADVELRWTNRRLPRRSRKRSDRRCEQACRRSRSVIVSMSGCRVVGVFAARRRAMWPRGKRRWRQRNLNERGLERASRPRSRSRKCDLARAFCSYRGFSQLSISSTRNRCGTSGGTAARSHCSHADSPRTLSVSKIDCAMANSAITRYAASLEVVVPSSVGASVPDRAAEKEKVKRGYGSRMAKATERMSRTMFVTRMTSRRICSPQRKGTTRSVSRRIFSSRCSGPTHSARPTRKRFGSLHRRLRKLPRSRSRAFSLVLDSSDGDEGDETDGKQKAETGASGSQRDEYSVRQEGE
jgi:hypothetical protein